MTSGYTAELGEKDKHFKKDIPVQREVGPVPLWSWRYLVVGEKKEQEALSRVAKKLTIRTSRFWAEVLASMYCHLDIILICQNARALLGRRSTSEVDNCFV